MDFSWLTGFLVMVLKDLYPYVLLGGAAIGTIYAGKYFLTHPESKWAWSYPLVIQAVKTVEGAIPDDTPNRSLAKADACMKMYIDLYTKHTGEAPSQLIVDWAMRMKELVLLDLDKIKASTPAVATPVVAPPVVEPKV